MAAGWRLRVVQRAGRADRSALARGPAALHRVERAAARRAAVARRPVSRSRGVARAAAAAAAAPRAPARAVALRERLAARAPAARGRAAELQGAPAVPVAARGRAAAQRTATPARIRHVQSTCRKTELPVPASASNANTERARSWRAINSLSAPQQGGHSLLEAPVQWASARLHTRTLRMARRAIRAGSFAPTIKGRAIAQPARGRSSAERL
jgi:hypothetical protein